MTSNDIIIMSFEINTVIMYRNYKFQCRMRNSMTQRTLLSLIRTVELTILLVFSSFKIERIQLI